MNSPKLSGSPAFRDLGGAPAAEGRRIATGRLFRADALTVLDNADRAVIEGLGLRLVCDLRASEERKRAECLRWLRPEPCLLHLEVSRGLNAAMAPLIDQLRRGPNPEAAAAMMRTTYDRLPAAAAPVLRPLFEALAAGEVPVLIHCTAGKDRTGFVIAMILTALGVTQEFIYADYLRGTGRDPLVREQPSSRLLEALVGRELTADEARSLHGVHRDYLDAALSVIERDWGDVHTYLEQAAGLDTRCRRALQRELLIR